MFPSYYRFFKHSFENPLKLLAEGCLPTIDTNDLHGIFEEHRVVRSINAFQNVSSVQLEGGIFGVEEAKFIFANVVVGRKATARFKILNPHKLRKIFIFSLINES